MSGEPPEEPFPEQGRAEPGSPPRDGAAEAGQVPQLGDGGSGLPTAVERGGSTGGDVFAIEGRPAAGLYVVGWLLGGFGVALLVLLLLAGSGSGRPLLAAIALGCLLLGSAAAAGYQVVARRTRPAEAYHGPAPLLVLLFAFALANLIGLALLPLGLEDLQTAPGFLLGVLVPFGSYLAALTLLVVRTGALSWRTMARLRPGPSAGRVVDFLVGAVAGLAIIVPVALAAALLAALLQVEPESQLPELSGGPLGLAIVVGAVIIAPVGEELFFRAFAYSAWRADLGPASALRRSALLFALVHILNVQAAANDDLGRIGARVLLQFLVILPAAVLLGVLYERRGLAGSLGTHMAYNGGLVALAALAASTAT
ncbi:MAG TPA: CPBP family intramembrane glutamic endopeptidase [Candidatus Dormibacteraeota bacterium]|nr:CPBP family intramembrane glutamic endopeptidase [Candidatus Dormibacteraeota bacterium]